MNIIFIQSHNLARKRHKPLSCFQSLAMKFSLIRLLPRGYFEPSKQSTPILAIPQLGAQLSTGCMFFRWSARTCWFFNFLCLFCGALVPTVECQRTCNAKTSMFQMLSDLRHFRTSELQKSDEQKHFEGTCALTAHHNDAWFCVRHCN